MLLTNFAELSSRPTDLVLVTYMYLQVIYTSHNILVLLNIYLLLKVFLLFNHLFISLCKAESFCCWPDACHEDL